MSSRGGPNLTIDRDRRSYRYFRNAVDRHWDPYGVDLSRDADRLLELDPRRVDDLKRTLALFGAGEQAVAEDLSPLATALEPVEDQLFVASQLYEEAKHAEFFDRYWSEVIHEVERTRNEDLSSPNEDRWFDNHYDELFARNEEALERLLVEDIPETRARAYCHYYLVIEGILAQTGYYGVQTSYSGETEELPELPGLVEGFTLVRSDEGRHVGFGMAKLKDMVEAGEVTPEFLHETVNELMPLTNGLLEAATDPDTPGVDPEELVDYAASRHTQRMEQIVDASADIPSVGKLVELTVD